MFLDAHFRRHAYADFRADAIARADARAAPPLFASAGLLFDYAISGHAAMADFDARVRAARLIIGHAITPDYDGRRGEQTPPAYFQADDADVRMPYLLAPRP